jgi:hypothetical protein
MILIAANIHEGSGEIIDFCGLTKNAPKGTSNPQADRSSRAMCDNNTLPGNPAEKVQKRILPNYRRR